MTPAHSPPPGTAGGPADTGRPDSAAFPLRVAAIDAGSNAIRFVAAEFDGPDRFRQLAFERVPVRLGRGAFLTGRLAEPAMEAAAAAFRGFRGRLDELGIEAVRAVATSAVRESRNGPDLVARIREASGIELGLISGGEEARLVWSAVRTRIDLGSRKWMLVDLGGGSVEVSLADDTGITWSESHTMGSVRLIEELEGADDAPGHFSRLLAEYASALRIPAAARHWTPVDLIATGGNIEVLADLAGETPGEGAVGRLSRVALADVIRRLSELSPRERVARLGLREDRADVILPAAIVYDRVAELAGAETILVPRVGVKEGVLLDLVQEMTIDRGFARGERIVREGALTLGRRYLFDEAHAAHVCDLALSLFDQLRELHGLPGSDRRLLIAAAILHDIGQHVSYRKHHKHSLYLILHSEIPGLSPAELRLVALVARYHRRADPDPSHYLYGDLSGEDRERVRRLAALLRVADSLDREHLQRIRGARARVEGGAMRLELEGEGAHRLERWALRRKGSLFGRVFGLEIETSPGTAAGRGA